MSIYLTKKELEAYDLLKKWGYLRRVRGVKNDLKKTPGDQWEPRDGFSYKSSPREFTRTVLINRLIKKGLAKLNTSNPNEVYLITVAKALGE